jgi:hypothetical protein
MQEIFQGTAIVDYLLSDIIRECEVHTFSANTKTEEAESKTVQKHMGS